VIYVPLLIVLINSFDIDRTFAWPPPGWTTQWWVRAWQSEGARQALWTSVKAGLGATAIALALGTMVAFAVQKYSFFGRNALSLLVVLPIALPGIITGIALDAAFRSVVEPLGVGKGLLSVVIGHATFCVVVVFTTFTAGPGVQTLPIWIFSNLFRPNQAPVINVVAAVLIVLSVVPIYLAQRISADAAGGGGRV